MKWKTMVILLLAVFPAFISAKQKEHSTCRKDKNLRKGKKIDVVKDIKEAIKFMSEVDDAHLKLLTEASLANFNYTSNLTNENKEIQEKASKTLAIFMEKIGEKMKEYSWKSFKKENATLYRWFKLMARGSQGEDSPSENKLLYRSEDSDQNMAEIFESAKLCPYKQPKKVCNIPLEPDVIEIMKTSRNSEELKHYWTSFRDATGKKIREKFIEYVDVKNKEAKKMGLKDFGALNLANYESKDIMQDMEEVVQKILPIYKQLHAYVRTKLRKYYKKDKIAKDGPIPAHLLGDMYAQKWTGIFSIVDPYPKQSAPDVTKSLIKKKLKPLDMFLIAEQFFTSIGMKKMTPHFWHYSMIEKPNDRKVQCHATAFDMHNNKDYRIKMCSEVNAEIFDTIHHEMGHIEYYMLYNTLPGAFQAGANYGFHEAVGDSLLLSVQTPSYLKQINLLPKKSAEKNKKHEISYLMKMALNFLTLSPYNYVIDYWRNRVYNGTIKKNELNKKYWEDVSKYQGVCPPLKRTESDFDIGAKYHIANGVEYLRYFFSNVLQFQIYKVLCKESGHKGPLHKCNFYKSKKAGRKFAKLLKVGASKPWKETLSEFTDNKTRKLDPEPMLEYFEPLVKWLKKKNKDEHIGWKSKNPMECTKSL